MSSYERITSDRIVNASPTVFIPKAFSLTPGIPKSEVVDPRAITRWSYLTTWPSVKVNSLAAAFNFSGVPIRNCTFVLRNAPRIG